MKVLSNRMLFDPAHRRIVIHLHIDYCTLVEILHVQESRQFTLQSIIKSVHKVAPE